MYPSPVEQCHRLCVLAGDLSNPLNAPQETPKHLLLASARRGTVRPEGSTEPLITNACRYTEKSPTACQSWHETIQATRFLWCQARGSLTLAPWPSPCLLSSPAPWL